MTKTKTEHVGTFKTLGEDDNNYDIDLYQDFLYFTGMKEGTTCKPGMKALYWNNKAVNNIEDNDYDFQIVSTGIKLKIIS